MDYIVGPTHFLCKLTARTWVLSQQNTWQRDWVFSLNARFDTREGKNRRCIVCTFGELHTASGGGGGPAWILTEGRAVCNLERRSTGLCLRFRDANASRSHKHEPHARLSSGVASEMKTLHTLWRQVHPLLVRENGWSTPCAVYASQSHSHLHAQSHWYSHSHSRWHSH